MFFKKQKNTKNNNFFSCDHMKKVVISHKSGFKEVKRLILAMKKLPNF
jgi:hypothetical protein